MSSYTSVRLEPVTLSVIKSFLNLGRKYEIKNLYLEATTRLSFEYPSTLNEWDNTRYTLQLIECDPGLAFDIINLAREHGLLLILPATFYNIYHSQDFFREIFEDVRREDGTLAILSFEDQKIRIKNWDTLVKQIFHWWRQEERNWDCST